MLLEDEMQGASTTCLVCSQDIHLGAAPVPAPTPAPAPAPGPLTELTADDVVDLEAFERKELQPLAPEGESALKTFDVKKCPKCNTPLRIPPEKAKQAVGCTECDFWGLVF